MNGFDPFFPFGRSFASGDSPEEPVILATFFDDNGDSSAVTPNPSDVTVNITAPVGTVAIVVAWMQINAQTSSVTVGGNAATSLSTHGQNQVNSSAHAILGPFSGSVAVRRVGARAGNAQHAVIWCIGGSTSALTEWRSQSVFQVASTSDRNVTVTPTKANGLLLAHMGHWNPNNGGTTSIAGVTEAGRDDTGPTVNQGIRSLWGDAVNSDVSGKSTTLSATGSVAKAGTIIHIPAAP